ncbi:MAG TPA: CpaF family protein [Anaerolineales bacterium]|nr:CpaF family protein [Anaerolineales bacterium]
MFENRPALGKKTNANGSEMLSPGRLDAQREQLSHIRDEVQHRVLAEFNGEVTLENIPRLRSLVEKFFHQVVSEENLLYTRANKTRMLEWILADILGYGPLEPLLSDPEITEIMVNGPGTIYVERFGKIELTEVSFENDAHLRRIIDRIVAPIGRHVDEASPMVDARLPSGYRVNATIPPLSLDGSLLTIRKFATSPFTAQDLISNGTLTTKLVTFLQACVEARVNIVVSGGTGSGKSTLLNVISSYIPANERIITIEDVAELQLGKAHVLRLEKRPPNIEGSGEITIRQLVINALRMRPDRILVGEARGGEALDMLQAMNTGHDGSMTTIHSNSPRDALRRIETMVLMAGMELPLSAIREQVSSAIELVVHLERLRDGTRKVMNVTEVHGMEGETIVMQDLFAFTQVDYKNGHVFGKLQALGLRPHFMEKFQKAGVSLPDHVFENN